MNTTSLDYQLLLSKLSQYNQSEAYPFHMPGHKRNTSLIESLLPENLRGLLPFSIDITEIDGFDNLHHAQEILAEAQNRAAALYGADKSFFLINGSTCGILASVFACTTQGGCLLAARNCHKAVYHAAELRDLDVIYLYPNQYPGGINGSLHPEDVEQAFQEHPEIQAVLITSPTYDGVVSDVKAIADIVHKYQAALIVDEAHGAHFGFHPYFPKSSVSSGADLVIHSLHKTLPSLTQTALLHYCRNAAPSGTVCSILTEERIKKYLGIFETSSPSYVFMAGMDLCVELIRQDGPALFSAFAENLTWIRENIHKLPHIHLLTAGPDLMDPSKLVIRADGLSGHTLSELLRQNYHLEMEMEAADYVIALTSAADSREGFERLLNALKEIDAALSDVDSAPRKPDPSIRLKRIFSISRAAEMPSAAVPLFQSSGKVSGEYLYLYPPGIPLIVPGEEISDDILDKIRNAKEKGLELQGLKDYSAQTIQILNLKN